VQAVLAHGAIESGFDHCLSVVEKGEIPGRQKTAGRNIGGHGLFRSRGCRRPESGASTVCWTREPATAPLPCLGARQALCRPQGSEARGRVIRLLPWARKRRKAAERAMPQI
jgi:hypothetical protein